MKKVFGLVALTMLFAACKDSYIKSKEGIEYKIISDGSGAKAVMGDILELNFERVYKDAKIDTVLMTTKDMGSQPLMLDSNRVPPLYIEIFSKVKKGDSVVIRIPTDSVLKNGAN